MDLAELMGSAPRVVAEHLLDGEGLELVVVGSGSPVRVDVVHRRGLGAGAVERPSHRHGEPLALGIGLRDVVGVAGGGIAGELGVDPCAPGGRVLERLQDEDARALPHDEAIAVLVEGPARPAGIVIAGAHRLHRAERSVGERRDQRPSLPPATMTSASPRRIRAASPREWVPVAQAETMPKFVAPGALSSIKRRAPSTCCLSGTGS